MSPVYKLSANSVKNGRTVYGSMLAGNTAFVPAAFESIATVTVGSGGASNVEFTSIPGTYTHLQVRMTTLCDTNTGSNVNLQFNSDTGSNYAWHELYGAAQLITGSGAGTSQTFIKTGYTGTDTTSYTGAGVIDILDYTNTNKYTTLRCLSGADNNTISTNGYILFRSGVWLNTNAITSIKLIDQAGNFKQYSHFALYGIRSA